MEFLEGQVFAGKFRVESLIGSGGMATVYRATHLLMQRCVALKLLRRELLADSNVIARFELEARAACRIDHPNVTKVYDFGYAEADDGVPYLVMEYVEGQTLTELLEREDQIEPRRALGLLAQVAQGLAAAHDVGVLHRDLKPNNIVLGPADNVKILDFGLAKLITSDALPSLTTKGSVFGTPEFMSPEQIEGRRLDHRTDIYTFGVLCS